MSVLTRIQMMNRRRRLGCMLLALLLWGLPAAVRAEDGAADEANAPLSCVYTLHEVNAGQEGRLFDQDVTTCVRVRRDRQVVAALPAGAAYVYLAWQSLPDAPLMSFLDEAGETLGTFAPDETLLYGCVPVPAGGKTAVLSAASDFAVSEMAVYESLPAHLPLATRPAQSADALLIVAHTGDESYYFGGLLPILAGEKAYTVRVLFLSSRSRLAEEEAILALRDSGVTEQPLFAAFDYRLQPPGRDPAPLIWKEAEVTAYIARAIRACTPDIVITHGAAGEDGDAMHAYTAALVRRGVELAADGKSLPPENGGAVWQAARLYEHSADGRIVLPVDTPLPAFGGLTARELAQGAFDRYTFLKLYHKTALAADTPRYALIKDYGEPESDPLQDLDIAAMPTFSPTPTATPTATPTPLITASPEPAAAENGFSLFCEWARAKAAVVMGMAGLLAAAWALFVALQPPEKAPAMLALCLIPLALGAVLAFALPAVNDALKPEPTPVPTPTPTFSPTPTPTPEPTPVPTPTPDPDDVHFRQSGDPPEVVVFDNENCIYIYRSDTLSVEIQRYDTRNNNNQPLRYFVAHLRMRDENAFRTGYGSYRENGRDRGDPLLIARRYKAVLAITGDNMVQTDLKNKGIIIRDGRIFWDNHERSAMVFTPDGMSMFYQPGYKVYAQELLDRGITDSVSFGPMLICDGVLNENANQHYLSGYNPRIGVGMIEEGHFVIIAVEGRVGKYSRGMKLSELAQLFYEQGCTQAYNLDGGASSCLLFMGEYLNRRMPKHYRDLPDLLMWGYSDLVPGVDIPPVNDVFYNG